MSEGYTALTVTSLDQLELITLQPGSGCSAAAIDAGCSVDSSMGFTPLEGLRLSTARNTAGRGTPARISTDDTILHAYVMPVDGGGAYVAD